MTETTRSLPFMDAPIVPAKSAAGFTIGMSFSEAITAISLHSETGDQNFSDRLNGEFHIKCKRGVWTGRTSTVSESKNQQKRQITTVTFEDNTIILYFCTNDRLHMILAGEGYTTKYGGVGIGDSVDSNYLGHALEFDSGDDMLYFTRNGQIIPGIALLTQEMSSFGDFPQQTTIFFAVHDWSIMSSD
ncbi:hypothetical protein [Neorhizobium sp. JUb45]|uniref:hypothetical protein n=1 Tax=unclassified Neorhizobium TaxID=2629175 RepID=UPI0010488E44|nr:hypothetical protein [Neorhizobium sp. JUb45]TCR06470.1 hypothetical protein EDF70_101427 [Neorhizobium sp. JUb45]